MEYLIRIKRISVSTKNDNKTYQVWLEDATTHKLLASYYANKIEYNGVDMLMYVCGSKSRRFIGDITKKVILNSTFIIYNQHKDLMLDVLGTSLEKTLQSYEL